MVFTTTPVNTDRVGAPDVVGPEVGVVAVAEDVLVDAAVVVDDAFPAFAEPDDPHAPVATRNNAATAPAHR